MIRLIVSDLDGTLLNRDQTVSRADLEMLRAAAESGIALCLASGRMDAELVRVMEEIGRPCHRISQNGAYVYTSDHELLHSATFEPDLARELFRAAEPYGLVGLICVGQTIYLPRRTEASDRIQARMFAPFTVHEGIVEEIGGSLVPCKLSFFGDLARLLEMKREVEQRFAGRMDAVVSDRDCVDLMPVGVTKGAGLTVLMSRLGLRPEEVACIGDAFNDLPMFQVTPNSFAMSHSHPEVRAAASRTVGNVAEAVEQILRSNRSSAPSRFAP